MAVVVVVVVVVVSSSSSSLSSNKPPLGVVSRKESNVSVLGRKEVNMSSSSSLPPNKALLEVLFCLVFDFFLVLVDFFCCQF